MSDMNNFNNGDFSGLQNSQIPQYPVPSPKPPRKSHTTAKVAAILAGVLIVGGGAGFGGTYLANRARSMAVVSSPSDTSKSDKTNNSNTHTSGTPTLDEMQKDVVAKQHTVTSNVEYKTDGTYMYTRDLVNAVRDSVVYIETFVNYRGQKQQYGAASGIIISKDGYIVTNNHVVEGGSEFTVKVSNTDPDTGVVSQETFDAKLCGTDSDTDLAVLKIEASDLPAAKLGDSDTLRLGDDVIAVGNPLGYESSVTKGIISGLNRQVSDSRRGLTAIQTDTPINSGNSGGALFNTYGEVIGVVNEKRVDSYAESLGFAITINEAKDVINDLIDKGYVSGRAILGITYINIGETAAAYRGEIAGWQVREIDGTMAVANSGLAVGDTIVKIDGKSVFEDDIMNVFSDKKPGDTVTVTVVRTNQLGHEKEVEIDIELSEYKGE